jgi:hypothetical protein
VAVLAQPKVFNMAFKPVQVEVYKEAHGALWASLFLMIST